MSESTKSILIKIFYGVTGFSALCTTIAVFVKGSSLQVNLAVGAVYLFLTAVFVMLWRTANRELGNKYPRGYKALAHFVHYKTIDGDIVSCELYKTIQIKRPFATHHEHPFYWTGSNSPEVSSNLQTISNDPIRETPGDEYNKLQLGLDKTALYNETVIIHIKMEIDDSNHASEPKVTFRVDEPVQVLRWNVELRYKADGKNVKPARLERRKINSIRPQSFKRIRTVDFDNSTKSYHTVGAPEVDYHYRLTWDR